MGRTRRRVASRSCGGWERTRLRMERKFSSMALLCASSASSARRVLVLVKGWEVVDHGGRGSVRARDSKGYGCRGQQTSPHRHQGGAAAPHPSLS